MICWPSGAPSRAATRAAPAARKRRAATPDFDSDGTVGILDLLTLQRVVLDFISNSLVTWLIRDPSNAVFALCHEYQLRLLVGVNLGFGS